jgi:hypothetical protein
VLGKALLGKIEINMTRQLLSRLNSQTMPLLSSARFESSPENKTYSIDTTVQHSWTVGAFTDRQADRKVFLTFTSALFPQLDGTMRAVIEFGNSNIGER